jgi:hypothetical protein
MLTFAEWTQVFVFERKGGVEEVTKFLRLMGAASSTVHRCVTQDMNPTQEDIDGIFEKYNTNNTEILLNDRGSVEDKVQLFLSINGFGSTTEIFNFLDSHPLLLPTSMRDLVRHIEQMLEKGILGRQGEEVFLVKTPARAVVMGKRSLNTTGLGFVGEIHKGIKLVEEGNHPISGVGTWTEGLRSGASLLLDSDSSTLPFGFPQSGANSVTGTVGYKFLGFTTKSDIEIALWKRVYVRDSPTYHIGNNCIHYANLLAQFLGTPDV